MQAPVSQYRALDLAHPEIIESLATDCGDSLAAIVIAARKAERLTDQKRISLLVGALTAAEKERDALVHSVRELLNGLTWLEPVHPDGWLEIQVHESDLLSVISSVFPQKG